MLQPVVEVAAPTAAHVAELVANLRQQDIDELRALGHEDLAAPIHEGVARSTWCHTLLIDGQVAAIFGVAPLGTLLDARGVPWLLGTDLIWPNRRALARLARRYILAMLRDHPHLTNIVHAKNTHATRWLRRAGFTLAEPQALGPHGEMFHLFEMRAHRV